MIITESLRAVVTEEPMRIQSQLQVALTEFFHHRYGITDPKVAALCADAARPVLEAICSGSPSKKVIRRKHA